jgi:4-hydroxy-tetrahydrodipicolinate reductase
MIESTKTIRFCLTGAAGKMGREVVKTLPQWQGIELVAALGLKSAGKSLRDLCGAKAPPLTIGSDLKVELAKNKVDVLLDFTEPASALKNALCAIEMGVAPLIGTSGLQEPELKELQKACQESKIPAMIVPNFSIGAVLGMKFAELAAKWIPNVEIVEIHHEQKLDAPSGTALETARLIQVGKGRPTTIPETKYLKVEGARGGKYADVPIHSIRLTGILAQQSVLFGGVGETLEIKHTTTDRSTYMGGVELSLRKILSQSGLTVGLGSILL